jgi:PiT family inorganic phosphate transporter
MAIGFLLSRKPTRPAARAQDYFSEFLTQDTSHLTVEIGDSVTCHNRYQGRLLGIEASLVLDWLHFVSAGLVSFARGLNDTPKIAALLLLVPQIGQFGSTAMVGVVMVVGGILSARKVAETMSQKITPMNHGQGFTANFITAVIVIGASGSGLPVSTTHVSCGSLFGIAAMNGQGHAGIITKILGAWIMTLPLGVVLGVMSFWILTLRQMG